jgi:hypothetical protein
MPKISRVSLYGLLLFGTVIPQLGSFRHPIATGGNLGQEFRTIQDAEDLDPSFTDIPLA